MRNAFFIGLLSLTACGRSGTPTDAAKVASDEPAPVPEKVQAKPEPEAKAEPEPEAKAEPPKQDAKPEASASRGLIIVENELQRLAPSGATEAVAEMPGVIHCDVDLAHGVVWLLSKTDIAAYDPTDGRIHPIAKGAGNTDTWSVRYFSEHGFPHQTAGNADGLDDCVTFAVSIDPSPKVGGDTIADGDRIDYCFEELTAAQLEALDEEDAPEPERVLLAEEAALEREYDKAKLLDSAYLLTLDARRKKTGAPGRPELKAPTAPKVEVDRSRCEEGEDDCGRAEYVGGSRLWWVVTATSRGDFFHETNELYDTKTKSFWNLETDERYAAPRHDVEENLPLEVSSDGTWGVYKGKILSLNEAKVTGEHPGTFCGFE